MKLPKTNKLVVVCAIMTLLLLLRCVENSFIIPAVVFGVGSVFFLDRKNCFPLLLFLLPFANIYKFSPEQISIFTLLFLCFIFRILSSRRFSIKWMFLIVVFLIYCLLNSSMDNIIQIGTLVLGFIMIYEVSTRSEYDFKRSLYAFCFGFILASSFVLFKEDLPILDTFINEISMGTDSEESIMRFSGLNRNPNYYTMDSSFILACLTVVTLIDGINTKNILLFLVISIFSLLSISKSFLIVWLFLVLFLVWYAMRKGVKMFVWITLSALIFILMLSVFASDVVDNYASRFVVDSEVRDMNEITTGRSEIWLMYWHEITKDPVSILFGNGIGAVANDVGCHNTYLELLYSLGVVGTFIFWEVLKCSVFIKTTMKKKFIFFLPILILLIRAAAIGLLNYDNTPFYISLLSLMFVYYLSDRRDLEFRKFVNN